jgi:hypothetical protein
MTRHLAKSAVGNVPADFKSDSGLSGSVVVPENANYVLVEVPATATADALIRFDMTAPTEGDDTTGFRFQAGNEGRHLYLFSGVTELKYATATATNNTTVLCQFYYVNQNRISP